MVDTGFRQGSYSACAFYHEEKSARVVAHGGDFTVLGPSKSLDWFRGVAQRRMEVKFKDRLERGKPGSVRILNRIATVTENGLEHEADQRRAEILMRDMGIDEGCKGVVAFVSVFCPEGRWRHLVHFGDSLCSWRQLRQPWL